MVALLRQRIRAYLEVHDERSILGASFHQPWRAVPFGDPQAAPLPAGVRVVDSTVEALTIKAERVQNPKGHETTIDKGVDSIEQITSRDRHVRAEPGRVVLVDPCVVARLDAEFWKIVEPGSRESVQRPSFRTVVTSRLRTIEWSLTPSAVEFTEVPTTERHPGNASTWAESTSP